jgi:hypothetical protein
MQMHRASPSPPPIRRSAVAFFGPYGGTGWCIAYGGGFLSSRTPQKISLQKNSYNHNRSPPSSACCGSPCHSPSPMRCGSPRRLLPSSARCGSPRRLPPSPLRPPLATLTAACLPAASRPPQLGVGWCSPEVVADGLIQGDDLYWVLI